MKRHFISLIIILLLSFCGRAQDSVVQQYGTEQQSTAPQHKYCLSDSAFASLLTCGPGDEFYTSFGHTALRLCDSINGIDVVYNYGCFDFGAPHFYLRFAQGQLDYFVERIPFASFMIAYMFEQRAVWEQRLLLTPSELEQLIYTLEENVKPENKYYKYDFFRDNCATRVRDIIEISLQRGHLTDTSHYPAEHNTYRSLLKKYTRGTLDWWQFGIDLLLGARCDREIAAAEYMYIPMEMMTQYDTTLLRPGGERLAEPVTMVLEEMRSTMPTRFSPALAFWLLFLLVAVLTFIGWRKGWRLIWLDGLLFGAVSLISLLLLFLWFGSDHYCTKWNCNLLWANPLSIWILLRLRKANQGVTRLLLGFMLVVLAGWFVLPQHFNIAVLPIVLTLLLRCASRLRTR